MDNEARGFFYAVGVGSGDPELMTFKAVEVIRLCEWIAYADSGGNESVALKISGQYIAGKSRLSCPMPMTTDPERLRRAHEEAAGKIAGILDAGKSVAFLVLGDPSIYATVMYVHRILSGKGYDTAIIPGIASFCAVAAAINQPLCLGDEELHIFPSSSTAYVLQA